MLICCQTFTSLISVTLAVGMLTNSTQWHGSKTQVFQCSQVLGFDCLSVLHILSLPFMTHTQGFIISISVSNWHKTSKTSPNKPFPPQPQPITDQEPKYMWKCAQRFMKHTVWIEPVHVCLTVHTTAGSCLFSIQQLQYSCHTLLFLSSLFSPCISPLSIMLSTSLSQLNKLLSHSLALSFLFLFLSFSLCILWRKFSGVFLCAWSNHVVADSD